MECGRSESGKGLVEKVLKGRWLEEAVFVAGYRYNKKLFEIWFWIGKNIKYVFDIFLQPNYKRD